MLLAVFKYDLVYGGVACWVVFKNNVVCGCEYSSILRIKPVALAIARATSIMRQYTRSVAASQLTGFFPVSLSLILLAAPLFPSQELSENYTKNSTKKSEKKPTKKSTKNSTKIYTKSSTRKSTKVYTKI